MKVHRHVPIIVTILKHLVEKNTDNFFLFRDGGFMELTLCALSIVMAHSVTYSNAIFAILTAFVPMVNMTCGILPA